MVALARSVKYNPRRMIYIIKVPFNMQHTFEVVTVLIVQATVTYP
jgi:hypothetical protein